MTQGNTGENWDGKDQRKAVDSNSGIRFFENQIVPMWASTKVAASILGISPNALRIRKSRGEIECRYFGKHLRFNVSHLQTHFRKTRKD